jgi:hypothetical protein
LVGFRTSLSLDAETKDFGLIEEDFRWENDCFWVVHEESMREAGPEVCSIDVDAAEFWKVDLFASGAKDLKSGCFQSVTETNWKDFLSIAKSSRAVSIGSG